MSDSLISEVFAALGDQTRLELVERLASSGPACIRSLSTGSRVTRQAVTKHLHVLRGAGLARECRLGRESIWQLQTEAIRNARTHLDSVAGEWDAALSRLKTFVEEDG